MIEFLIPFGMVCLLLYYQDSQLKELDRRVRPLEGIKD